jgi:SAM-dependent methyltransferase
MIDEHINNPKSPKYYVKRYLHSIKNELKDKIVLDIPAGNGATTEILQELGSKVEAYDLFPEYFLLKDIHCQRANITERIPVKDSYADFLICQEGIEHFSDQAKAFKEFNRVLKTGGRLIITTPSYSNLKAKLSYLLFETEYFNKMMPPNEIDSIWMADPAVSKEIYHGHIFLVGIQKLRVLAKLAGFKIHSRQFVRTNKTSLFLFPFYYPFILISSWYTYRKAMKAHPDIPAEKKKKIYLEQYRLNTSRKTLLDEHTFVIFEKEIDSDQVFFSFNDTFKPLGKLM